MSGGRSPAHWKTWRGITDASSHKRVVTIVAGECGEDRGDARKLRTAHVSVPLSQVVYCVMDANARLSNFRDSGHPTESCPTYSYPLPDDGNGICHRSAVSLISLVSLSQSLSHVIIVNGLLPLTSFAKAVRSARLRLPPRPRIRPQAKSAFEVDPATCSVSYPPCVFPSAHGGKRGERTVARASLTAVRSLSIAAYCPCFHANSCYGEEWCARPRC